MKCRHREAKTSNWLRFDEELDAVVMRRLHNRRADFALLAGRSHAYIPVNEFTNTGHIAMIGQIASRLRTLRATRRTVNELNRMDDRMLSDIGVLRGDIERMVRVGR